jgi:hypothetical protein
MSNDHARNAALALIPRDGFNRPSAGQLHEADVHAHLATATALDRIADALEALAANTAPDTVLQPTIHHSH